MIIDDHIAAREGISALINFRPGWIVCSTAASCEEALREAKTHQPDLIIVDLRLPDCDGCELIRLLLALTPQSKILAVSMSADPLAAKASLDAGASAFLHKDTLRHSLYKTVDMILDFGSSPILSSS